MQIREEKLFDVIITEDFKTKNKNYRQYKFLIQFSCDLYNFQTEAIKLISIYTFACVNMRIRKKQSVCVCVCMYVCVCVCVCV